MVAHALTRSSRGENYAEYVCELELTLILNWTYLEERVCAVVERRLRVSVGLALDQESPLHAGEDQTRSCHGGPERQASRFDLARAHSRAHAHAGGGRMPACSKALSSSNEPRHAGKIGLSLMYAIATSSRQYRLVAEMGERRKTRTRARRIASPIRFRKFEPAERPCTHVRQSRRGELARGDTGLGQR